MQKLAKRKKTVHTPRINGASECFSHHQECQYDEALIASRTELVVVGNVQVEFHYGTTGRSMY